MYISYVIKPVCKTLQTRKQSKDRPAHMDSQKEAIEHQNASVHHSSHVFSALLDSDSGPVHLLEEDF